MYSREILLERAQLALLRFLWTILAVLASIAVWHQLVRGQDVTPWSVYLVPSVIVAGLMAIVMWNTPALDLDSPMLGTLRSILRGIAIVVLATAAISFFYRADSYSRGTLLVFVPVAAIALFGAAGSHVLILRAINSSTVASRRVIVVGMASHGQRIARTLQRQPGYYDVVGYLDERPMTLEGMARIPYLGSPAYLSDALDEHNVDVAIIALGDEDETRTQEAIGICMSHGVDWKVVPPMLGLLPDKLEFEFVGGLPLVGQRRSRLVGYNWYVKRSFDIVISFFLIVLLSPILAGAWILVRLTSKGPAVFRQQRVGLNGELFTLLKFRTMKVDTDTGRHQAATAHWITGKHIETADGDESSVHKITDDDRVTSVGHFLRMTSIDELPQLFNVLRGDMSLVGPRPPISYEVERYSERHKRRLDVPPGVTGLWQVSGRNSLSFDDMVELDITYIEHWSLALDLEILLRTIPAVVSDHGY